MAATTASTVKIAITPMSGSVPACKPNLMPFHINYNGPAAVSTFIHVEKLVDTVESAEIHGCELQVQADKSPEDAVSGISAETQRLQATTSSHTIDGALTLTRTTTESTLVTEPSLTTLEGSHSDVSVTSFSQVPAKSQVLAPPIEDLDKRFISTFRGRTIHGLTINLPEGYTGLVLKAKSDRLDAFDEKEKNASCGTGRGGVQRTMDVDLDVEMESLGRRRRERLRSSAAPRKGTVITISDDDNTPQSSNPLNSPEVPYGNDIEMTEAPCTSGELDGPRRILVPSARFDSFTLWQADRMVNKSNDEYWRTLTEWIGLAHEIHNVDV